MTWTPPADAHPLLARIDRRLPRSIVSRPDRWVLASSLLVAVGVIIAWTTDLHPALWIATIVAASLPSVIATVIVLSSTPRGELQAHDSVFGHFLVRFLMLVVGFFAWTLSVVVSAGVSSILALASENREDEITANGLALLAVLAVPVTYTLWIVFLLRCAWFLGKLRGWRRRPATTRIPPALLAGSPRLRALTIGLAHPGSLVVTAVATTAVALTDEVLNVVLN